MELPTPDMVQIASLSSELPDTPILAPVAKGLRCLGLKKVAERCGLKEAFETPIKKVHTQDCHGPTTEHNSSDKRF